MIGGGVVRRGGMIEGGGVGRCGRRRGRRSVVRGGGMIERGGVGRRRE